MNISIYNCNNIDEGVIEIESGKLNVKYAVNGTGKSTIAKGISSIISKEDLSYLMPFKHNNSEDETLKPKITISEKIKNISIFDEKYIEKFVFKRDELIENSFDVFIKTPKYDEKMMVISESLSEIFSTFQNDIELDKMTNYFKAFIDSFGRTKNGYSKTSEIGKSVGEGNKIANIPERLSEFAPFLKNPLDGAKWIKWHIEGSDYIDTTNQCPFCLADMELSREKITEVNDEYDGKYVEILNKVINNADTLKMYFSNETNAILSEILNNADGIRKDQIEYLKRLKVEVFDMYERLISLKKIGFYTLRDVGEVKVVLQSKIIDIGLYHHLNNSATKRKINKINKSLRKVIKDASILQGQINSQKDTILKTVKKNRKEINDFLSSSGFNYLVDFVEGDDNIFRLVLKFQGNENIIENVRNHLSYGERNMFALLMFKYQTIKSKVDFIILDDPISSFDKHKKFSILTMLFRGKNSFMNKTVLMLTHDFEPIIDMSYTMRRIFGDIMVSWHVHNSNGKIKEKLIKPSDIKPAISIYESNIDNAYNIVSKMIFYRRFIESNDEKGCVWDLISNLFHKDREIPKIKNVEGKLVDMEQIDVINASKIIKERIKNFEYESTYNEFKNKEKMISLFKSVQSGYEKIHIYRILFDGELVDGSFLKKFVNETFHVQNDYLFQLNPLDFEYVPQYILNFCESNVVKLENELNVDEA